MLHLSKLRRITDLSSRLKTVLVTTSISAALGILPNSLLASESELGLESTLNPTPPRIERVSTTLSIHTFKSWVGIDSKGTLWATNLDRENNSVGVLKSHPLSTKDQDILRRFITNKGLMRYGKENETLTNEQADILKETLGENISDKEKLEKTIHIDLWEEGEHKKAILVTTPTARDKWPEDMQYLLRLISRLTKEAKSTDTQGIGFLQNLDYQKEPNTTWTQWAKRLNSGKDFHKLSEPELQSLPAHLQQMINYPGFLVPLQERDLLLMTSLGWSEPENPPNTNSSINLPSPFDIWWGIIEYKTKTYGINAWRGNNITKN